VKPTITIFLAAYNGISFIADQLETLFLQKKVEVNLTISIDLSTDGTLEHVQSLTNLNPRVNILYYGESYSSAGSNFFRLFRDSDLTKVDYVALCDQDDIWQADKLSHAVKRIQENIVDAYSSNVTAFWPNGQQKLINKAQPQQQWDYMFESAGPGCTFVMTKKLGLEIQQFLIENQEACRQVALHDWFIYAFARSRGFKWFIDDESHMLYRQHAENVVGANVGIKAKINRWKKMRDSWHVKQAILIADILGYSNKFPIRELKNYGFVDRLILIVNARKLRRRLRDCFALAIFFLFPLKK
jgi:rhamnosyltransferase